MKKETSIFNLDKDTSDLLISTIILQNSLKDIANLAKTCKAFYSIFEKTLMVNKLLHKPAYLKRKLKELSRIPDLKFVSPYQNDDICKLNNVTEYPAGILSEKYSLEYFSDLFNQLDIKKEVYNNKKNINKEGITRVDKSSSRDIKHNMIIIKDLTTQKKLAEAIYSEIEMENALLIEQPCSPFTSDQQLSESYQAMLNILRSLVVNTALTELDFETLISTMRSTFENLEKISFAEMENSSSKAVNLACILKGLLEDPLETEILSCYIIKNLNASSLIKQLGACISSSMISDVTKIFLTQELFALKPFLVSLKTYILSKVRDDVAEDGRLYKKTYTEIMLFLDPAFIPQSDGSVQIDFKNADAYKDYYAPGKKFEKKLDKELDHLFKKVGIEPKKINGSYHNGCIILAKDVIELKKKGIVLQSPFNYELLAEKTVVSKVINFYSTLKLSGWDNKRGISLPDDIHDANHILRGSHIADACDFKLYLISKLKKTSSDSIEIYAEDKKTASFIEAQIRKKLKIQPDDTDLRLVNNIVKIQKYSLRALTNLIFDPPSFLLTRKNPLPISSSKQDNKEHFNNEPTISKWWSRKEESSIKSQEIADAFGFDSSLIVEVKSGLVESIEIYTKNIAIANSIEDDIRKKLESHYYKTYGGTLRVGGISNLEPMVEISFDALNDFKEFISNRGDSLIVPAKKTLTVSQADNFMKGVFTNSADQSLLKKYQRQDKDLPSPELALRRVAADGALNAVKLLIKKYPKIDINAVAPKTKMTALDWANKKGYSEVAKLLIDNGAKLLNILEEPATLTTKMV